MSQQQIYTFLIFIVPLLFSLSFHEAAHAWAAKRRGDDTAYLLGRMTLNPIVHIDLWGTIIFPAVLILSGTGILFGWAKPVPVNPLNLKNFRKDDLFIALAGPVSNLILAVVFALMLHLLVGVFGLGGAPGANPMLKHLVTMLYYGVPLNLALAFFNLLPVPPLDGSHILKGLVSETMAQKIDQYQHLGFFILILMMATGMLKLLWLPIQFCMGLLLGGLA